MKCAPGVNTSLPSQAYSLPLHSSRSSRVRVIPAGNRRFRIGRRRFGRRANAAAERRECGDGEVGHLVAVARFVDRMRAATKANRQHPGVLRGGDIVIEAITDHCRLFRIARDGFERVAKDARVGLAEAEFAAEKPLMHRLPETRDVRPLLKGGGWLAITPTPYRFANTSSVGRASVYGGVGRESERNSACTASAVWASTRRCSAPRTRCVS